jgi:hypothetical protein
MREKRKYAEVRKEKRIWRVRTISNMEKGNAKK